MGLVDDVTAVAETMRGRRTLAVTGAGISTDAGVPDYRGAGAPERPSVEYEDFVFSELWQRLVWWRNELSWRTLAEARPTAGHRALARLEHAGLLGGVATQNVDRLHSRADSRVVAELHGRFDTAVCLHCGLQFTRARVSELIRATNPSLTFPAVPLDRIEILAAKDRAAAAACPLVVPPCPECDGMLKPDVVFFGEPLPEAPVRRARALAADCDVVLAVGTSLAVSTGMWVVLQAVEAGATLVVVNRGPTEADRLADLRVEGGASEVLAGVAAALLEETP